MGNTRNSHEIVGTMVINQYGIRATLFSSKPI